MPQCSHPGTPCAAHPYACMVCTAQAAQSSATITRTVPSQFQGSTPVTVFTIWKSQVLLFMGRSCHCSVLKTGSAAVAAPLLMELPQFSGPKPKPRPGLDISLSSSKLLNCFSLTS
mmetsp:Transcript_35615/g.79168  ORF Transcript_35615/g.79168 Transcript_35615/m.79168 type:complete len:116 (-) Transcript_35615:1404-1751(-)